MESTKSAASFKAARNFRQLLAAGAVIAAIAAAIVGWALFWPESPCADPVCAKQRFSIFVELDTLGPVEPAPLELKTDGGLISVRSVLAEGGIDVQIAVDQKNLPYSAAAGSLNDADLFQLAKRWRNREAPPGVDAKLYALAAPRLVSNTGEALFGMMFDTADREGFAIAPPETIDRFSKQTASSIPVLQMRTFLHELLHALNRSHLDAARLSGGHLTVEAPTLCIADTKITPWSLNETPALQLSPTTILFFQTADVADVLPGKENKPFQLRRGSADECQELRQRAESPLARSRWALAMKRLKRLPDFGVSEANAAESAAEGETARAELRVQALPVAYPLGYPVAVRLIASNTGQRALPLRGRLHPSFGLVQIDTRKAGQGEWKALKPMIWFEPADDKRAQLEPGLSAEQTVPVYFGEAGWTFPEAGAYEVRARLKVADDFEEVVTEPVRIEVTEPAAERDTKALQLLLDDDGRLDMDTGQLLNFGGRVGERADLTPIERLVTSFPDTALGAALRLTLASHSLRRTLDPETGTRAPPDVAGSRRLLANACMDSGVSALRRQLMVSHGERVNDDEHTAWDGRSNGNTTRFQTYSDPELTPAGPSIHFCVDERRMRNTAWNGAQGLAKTVRAMKPARVVVIGHTDEEGGCGFNDGLGLERAESVKNVLVKNGIRPQLIQTVTLGKRRPLDFSSTDDARMLNRRVEVLIERGAPDKISGTPAAAQSRAIPSCPQWNLAAG